MELRYTDGLLSCLSITTPEFYSNDTWPIMHCHLSAISDIIHDGRLFMQVQSAFYDAEAVVGFLRILLGKIFSNAEYFL